MGAGAGAVSGEAGLPTPVAPSALPGASDRPGKARTRAPGTCSLAAEISFGAIQRAFVSYAGASGFVGDAPADRLGRADGVDYGR
ncbi:hypothetical protein Shyd_85380 [Streptomyces hydrogenans]|uniref:Uncharacterized protein n=1 Tax=Streptomyces hydrogenans TaxID=1873719 RepID=A0ABQ3PQ84_9ACTN|nr:hypothetical protein Shyd_85380 [Streptomyces hydrogenans]